MKTLFADAFLEIRSHLGKSMLTAVAISVGVLSIIGVAIEAEFSRVALRATSEQTTGRAVTVGVEISPMSLSPAFVEEMSRSFDHRVGNDHRSTWFLKVDLSSEIEVVDLQSESTIPGATVNLIRGSLGGVRRLPVVAGDAIQDSSDVGWVYLNVAAAEQLTAPISTIALRRPIHDTGATFSVRGVVDDGDPGAKVYADLASYVRYDPATASRSLISIYAHGAELPADVLSAALSDSLVANGLVPVGAISRVDETGDLELGTAAVQRGFALASIVTFIVAAVGTANVGLSSVRERRREFAIRRAVGFTQRRVATIVLVAQLTIGLVASIASVVLCGAFAYGLLPGLSSNPLVDRPAFPWTMAGLAVIAGVVAALLGAIAPSSSAARTSIGSVLR